VQKSVCAMQVGRYSVILTTLYNSVVVQLQSRAQGVCLHLATLTQLARLCLYDETAAVVRVDVLVLVLECVMMVAWA